MERRAVGAILQTVNLGSPAGIAPCNISALDAA